MYGRTKDGSGEVEVKVEVKGRDVAELEDVVRPVGLSMNLPFI